jgi:hypothetical protein
MESKKVEKRDTYQDRSILEHRVPVAALLQVLLGSHTVLELKVQIFVSDPNKLRVNSGPGRLVRIKCKTKARHLRKSAFELWIFAYGIF